MCLLAASSEVGGQSVIPLVSERMAHKLAASTLSSKAQHFSGMRFDREKGYHPKGFYWFEVTANVPDGASPLLGYFAVNEITGDVWDPIPCRELKSSFIRRFQQQMVGAKRISTAEFQKASRNHPCEP